VRAANGPQVASFDDVVANTPRDGREPSRPHLLPPVDLQVIKAAGVTFPVSMLERVIEERAGGDRSAAHALRADVQRALGGDLAKVRPGSPEAGRLKEFLVGRDLWSQYLEVGIGPDAEIFTKAPVLAAVGTGAEVGVLRDSHWNNPEPEVALVVSSAGRVVGATLGNDVNLRDVEGRSALLLPRAKDNNASCSLGPLLRLFDGGFTMDDVRAMEVGLTVEGTDGFRLDDVSQMTRISRDPQSLVGQLMGADHQYPDGAVLMLGTMFAPVVDRDAVGLGFTHHDGDVVRIHSDQLGTLVNVVRRCDDCEPWTYGIGALMRNLAERRLL
jgi:fumarylacetoacetate (FAA) hydrolase family protein